MTRIIASLTAPEMTRDMTRDMTCVSEGFRKPRGLLLEHLTGQPVTGLQQQQIGYGLHID